ncbi:MAG TPA: chemotaxis protein CheW [Longimicrobiales bacterium]
MDQATETTTAAAPATQRGGKYLTFFLAGEEYGVEILKVHEIIGLLPITRVPRTPEFIRGVINLRGRVIPTVDLRLKFGMPMQEPTDQTCIVVVQVGGVQFGLIVDRVSEVLDIAEADVEDPPNFGADVDTRFLLGVAKTAGRVRLLLDIDRVLSEQEIISLQGIRQAVEERVA